MRNRDLVKGVDSDFERVRTILLSSFDRIEKSFRAGDHVVGIDKEGLDILRAELDYWKSSRIRR